MNNDFFVCEGVINEFGTRKPDGGKWKLEAACPQCIEDCDKIIHTMSIEKETSLELKDNSLFATSKYLYITKTSE